MLFSYYFPFKNEIKSAKEKEIEENKVMSEINDSLDNYFSVITCDRIEYERRRIKKSRQQRRVGRRTGEKSIPCPLWVFRMVSMHWRQMH